MFSRVVYEGIKKNNVLFHIIYFIADQRKYSIKIGEKIISISVNKCLLIKGAKCKKKSILFMNCFIKCKVRILPSEHFQNHSIIVESITCTLYKIMMLSETQSLH